MKTAINIVCALALAASIGAIAILHSPDVPTSGSMLLLVTSAVLFSLITFCESQSHMSRLLAQYNDEKKDAAHDIMATHMRWLKLVLTLSYTYFIFTELCIIPMNWLLVAAALVIISIVIPFSLMGKLKALRNS